MKMQPTPQEVNKKIFFIRNCRVMLDSDLAHLYQVETKNLNKAVKRNMNRFPEDFMFQITAEELAILRFQAGTPKVAEKTDHRGRRSNLPFAFTEQGVAMLSDATWKNHWDSGRLR
jgi:metal-dependent HD superfamily phosphatase/phosphodiesterase